MSPCRPKILQVTGSLAVGGAERVALELAAGMKARGWRAELATLCARADAGGATPIEEPLRAEAGHRGLFVRDFSLPSIRDRHSRRLLVEQLAEQRYDLIHVHSRPADWQLALLAPWVGTRVLYTRHLPYRDLSLRQRALYAAAAQVAPAVVAISQAVARHLRRAEAVPRWKIRVICDGIDLSLYRPPTDDERAAKRRELGLDEEAFVWLSAARLVPQKGLAFLLEALARLPRGSRARLLVAGEGPELAALTARATRLALGGRVRFLGMRREVSELLWAADGYVCTSLGEGQGLALVEAMAAGLPVVAPRLACIEELSADGAICFFGPSHKGWARSHDPADITRALREVEGERWARRELGRLSREHVERHYSLEAMLGAHERLYREVLG